MTKKYIFLIYYILVKTELLFLKEFETIWLMWSTADQPKGTLFVRITALSKLLQKLLSV